MMWVLCCQRALTWVAAVARRSRADGTLAAHVAKECGREMLDKPTMEVGTDLDIILFGGNII